jgi:hypothetical protein
MVEQNAERETVLIHVETIAGTRPGSMVFQGIARKYAAGPPFLEQNLEADAGRETRDTGDDIDSNYLDD